MRVWDIHHDETLGLPQGYTLDQLRPLIEARTSHLHRYRLGQLALHSGLYLHQPEPARDLKPDDHERITLQGHGLRSCGRWQLFW